jgi:formylglycine-generating enzyme required for sulfatase activity
MRYIRGKKSEDGYCIDRFEYPGRGKTPHRASLAAAKSTCRARGLRLCTAKEWIRACGGLFPYGREYDAERCNTGNTKPVPSGSQRGCRSRWGVYDMSGNAAEWVAGGTAMGGDFRAEQGHAGCMARSSGGATTGFRCCSDPEWY